jgi:hypothetical protein
LPDPGADAEQQRRHQLHQRGGRAEPEPGASACQHGSVPHEPPSKVSTLGAEGHPDAELARPL